MASLNGEYDSLTMNADAKIYLGLFNEDQKAKLDLDPKRKYYLHLIKGSLEVNGLKINGGDALMMSEENIITIDNGVHADLLVLDLSSI